MLLLLSRGVLLTASCWGSSGSGDALILLARDNEICEG